MTTMDLGQGATYSNKENIQVMIRVRPLLPREDSFGKCLEVFDNRLIRVYKGHTPTELSFDTILDEDSTQDDVYDRVRASIEAVLEGINSTVFAYGQTGTGKTYTMFGLDVETADDAQVEAVVNAEMRGIIPRAVQQLFEYMQSSDTNHQVFCSYMEIYNEKLYDLLQYERTQKLRTGLDLREDRTQGVFVQDLSEVEVCGVQDVLSLMVQGARNRAIAHTEMNDYSSRSHTIFQLVVETRDPSDEGVIRRAKLNLVDLAGSEKWRTSYDLGPQRVQELTSINQSLSSLGNCIAALTQPGRSHIPFRDSKLTRLLQDSLGGNTRTSFIATVSPSVLCLDETCSTLKFADRAKRVVSHVRVNETVDQSTLLKRYEAEIERLQEIIASMSADGTDGNRSAGLVQQLQLLESENVKLKEEYSRSQLALHQEREEHQRLLRVFKTALEAMRSRASGKSGQSAAELASLHETEMFRVENEFLRAKLAQVEAVQYDQQTRQSELDAYHRWLRALPLQHDGESYSTTMEQKLEMLEKSIQLQQTELLRTKQLFVTDLCSLQQQIRQKSDELAVAERRESQLLEQLGTMQRLLANYASGTSAPLDAARLADIQAQLTALSTRPELHRKENAQQVIDKMRGDLGKLERTFRSNLDSAFSVLRERFLAKQAEDVQKAAEPLHTNTIQVVMGCLNALFQAVGTIQSEATERLMQPLQLGGELSSRELEQELLQLRMMLTSSQTTPSSDGTPQLPVHPPQDAATVSASRPPPLPPILDETSTQQPRKTRIVWAPDVVERVSPVMQPGTEDLIQTSETMHA